MPPKTWDGELHPLTAGTWRMKKWGQSVLPRGRTEALEDPNTETEDGASGEQDRGKEGQVGGFSTIRFSMLTCYVHLWWGPK